MATKIFLADLAHTYSVADRSIPVPLGIGYIKAYAARALGDRVEIRLFKHPDRFLAALSEQPAVIGFANYGWNENLNRAVGRYVRRAVPGALIVAGGPNIDPDPERRLAFLSKHDYVDYLIIDGGEEPFAELVAWHLEGTHDPARLPMNVVWRDGVSVCGTAERPLKKVIEGIPSPYLAGYLDDFLTADMIPLFETNRGCPFACTFCAWGSASKDLVRRFDLQQALDEIAYVGERSDARNWIICDANFGILPRDIEIARAIRRYKDERGRPEKCHLWLAKNVTERNLAVGEILNEMIVPVMAIQSMDPEVLRNIKRDNISIDTYEQYQQRFHRMGSRTYSDLIVPMPAETPESHLKALRKLMELGVDIISNNNMRMLAGAEASSAETRQCFVFRTRYRLIHGDAGIYRAADGTEITAFEYEESLRSTTTISETDLFYLRKLHFLVDFCWNTEVYRPLLNLGLLYGLNPVDALAQLIEEAEAGRHGPLQEFFAAFDRESRDEWFENAEDIEAYFAAPANFARLLGHEFEKLNIQFGVIALRDYKPEFDAAMLDVLREANAIPAAVLDAAARVTFALFPPIGDEAPRAAVDIPANLLALSPATRQAFLPSSKTTSVQLIESAGRRKLRGIIAEARQMSLSKVLNTQHIYLSELKLAAPQGMRFERAFLAG